MSSSLPSFYEFQRYDEATIATRIAFGKDAKLIEPVRPRQGPRVLVEDWVEPERRQLNVPYEKFALAAITSVIHELIKPAGREVFRDYASLRFPLPPAQTSEGNLPASLLIDNLSLQRLSYETGNKIYGLAPDNRHERVFYPRNFLVSTEVGDSDHVINMNLLQPAYRHNVAEFTLRSTGSPTRFILPDRFGEIITLPPYTESRHYETWYAYAAALAKIALDNTRQSGAEGVEIEPGQSETFSDRIKVGSR